MGKKPKTVSEAILLAFRRSKMSMNALSVATRKDSERPASGVSYPTIHRWATKRGEASVRVQDEIAKVLKIEVYYDGERLL